MRADARTARVPLHVSASIAPTCFDLRPSCDDRRDSSALPRLFLTADNEFAGDNQQLTVEEAKSHTDGMTIL